MGYFIIIVFSTFMGSPPEFLPVAFKSGADCENYLTTKVINDYLGYRLETTLDKKYLFSDYFKHVGKPFQVIMDLMGLEILMPYIMDYYYERTSKYSGFSFSKCSNSFNNISKS